MSNSPETAAAVALMITRRCNMSCGHCSVESGPNITQEPSEEELMGYVHQCQTAGLQSVLITGGEPALRFELVLRLLETCKKLGLATVMNTNGSWGKKLSHARAKLNALQKAGLRALTVSYDRYHAEFQGHQPALNILKASEETGFSININVVRVADEPELKSITVPFEYSPNARLRYYDVQSVGRAANLPRQSLRGHTEGFCGACATPAITDDGRFIACNGPAYFLPTASPLVIGSLKDESLQTLLSRHWDDPLLDAIRTLGPGYLQKELCTLPGFENFPFRQYYSGLCELCHQITGDAEAVQALRIHLKDPVRTAHRRAVWQVIKGSRLTDGEINRNYVNREGACKLLLHAAIQPSKSLPVTASNIFGRADIDWNHLASYLSGCGLARPLLPVLSDPVLAKSAPKFFIDNMEQRATQDGLKELIIKETLRRMNIVFGEMNCVGILLKGAARIATATQSDQGVPRCAGDIDVYVTPSQAKQARIQLIRSEFNGEIDAAPTASHHLAPIFYQGVMIEIHTRIMPAFWGLPEKEMLNHTLPVPGRENLSVLDAEGFLLHSGSHISTHVFSHGLKVGWDIMNLVNSQTKLDWDRLGRWVTACAVPRSFWTPVRVLCRELDLPLPSEFLSLAPKDKLQGRLEEIAHRRLFHQTEGHLDLNVFSKNAVYLLLQDSWMKRTGYIAGFACKHAASALGIKPRNLHKPPAEDLPRQLRQAWAQWKQYRQATSSARAD